MFKPSKAIILAGGKGKRMGDGSIPKVLHEVRGKPMLHHVINTLLSRASMDIKDIIVVVGENRQRISASLKGIYDDIILVDQKPPRGTGDAVAQCLHFINEEDTVVIVNGDTPLIDLSILLLIHCSPPSVLVANVEDPSGQGRIIIGDEGEFKYIVEEKDATPEEKSIKTVNTGLYHLTGKDLLTHIPKLDTNNAQGEYYLTDVLKYLTLNASVNLCVLPDLLLHEITNVNTQSDLAIAEQLCKI